MSSRNSSYELRQKTGRHGSQTLFASDSLEDIREFLEIKTEAGENDGDS